MEVSNGSLVQVYASYLLSDRLWVLMELCNGTLLRELRKNFTYPIQKVRSYASTIIKGLVMLHGCGWVHGNMNACALLMSFGECKLMPMLGKTYPKENGYERDI